MEQWKIAAAQALSHACPHLHWLTVQRVCIIHTVASREVIRRLEADGWILVRTKGSHNQYEHPSKPGLVTVPHPKKDLPTGTLRSIYRQAGWNWE